MFLPWDYSGPHWTYAPGSSGLVNFKIDAVFRLGGIAYGAGGNVSRRRAQKKKGCSNHFAARGIQVHSGFFQTELCEFQTLARVATMSRTTSFMKVITLLLPLFTLASCIDPPRTEFMGPNGRMVYAITCQTMDDCATEARELCPSGHDIVPGASGAGNTTARAGIGDMPAKRLLIECKAPSP